MEIFVQRAQRMYETRPMRTALFRWEMEQVDIMALADPSFHGYDNVVRNIQEMDPDSPWPDEAVEFTTLWCRAVRATCRQWRFVLRDFPQPLLDIHELLLFGRLAGAEQLSSWRARRTCVVPVAAPWTDVQIERGMSALKFYHDFSCDAESWRLAYGPCWEPVIAQCNLAWDFVSPPSKDPSPPLPFWDKIRLLFHGRVTLSVQQLTLLLHTSLDPYNTTEEMELTWTDLAMDWTNANFILKGNLIIFCCGIYIYISFFYRRIQCLRKDGLQIRRLPPVAFASSQIVDRIDVELLGRPQRSLGCPAVRSQSNSRVLE